MNQVELYIEELVLHGFSQEAARHIRGAVEAELTRLFAIQGIPPSLSAKGEFERLDGGSFEMKPDLKPVAIGNQIAKSVYTGFTKTSIGSKG